MCFVIAIPYEQANYPPWPPCWSWLDTATVRRLQAPIPKTALLGFGLGPIGRLRLAVLALGAVVLLLLAWGNPVSAPFLG